MFAIGGRREDLLVSGKSDFTLASSSSSSSDESSDGYVRFSSGNSSPRPMVLLGGGGSKPNALRSAVEAPEEGDMGEATDSMLASINGKMRAELRRRGVSSSKPVARRAGKGGGVGVWRWISPESDELLELDEGNVFWGRGGGRGGIIGGGLKVSLLLELLELESREKSRV